MNLTQTEQAILTGPADEALLLICRGNQAAARFVDELFSALHVWDDLRDMDAPVSQQALDEAMWRLLVSIPGNTFYQQNFAELNALLANAIQSWHAANVLEEPAPAPHPAGEAAVVNDKRIAFILRSDYVSVLQAVARITGGYYWAREVIPAIRRRWHNEGFPAYLEALEKEHSARAQEEAA